jgi:hypothetical protein
MGAKAGESCSFCGTKMNQGSTVCAGCGAQRKEGVQGRDIFFALMGGLGTGFLIFVVLFFTSIFFTREITLFWGVLFVAAFLIPPIIILRKDVKKKKDQVIYVRRQ